MEGLHPFNSFACSQGTQRPPIFEYNHSAGNCSITGGYVYRGRPCSFVGAYCTRLCSVGSVADATGGKSGHPGTMTRALLASFGRINPGSVRRRLAATTARDERRIYRRVRWGCPAHANATRLARPHPRHSDPRAGTATRTPLRLGRSGDEHAYQHANGDGDRTSTPTPTSTATATQRPAGRRLTWSPAFTAPTELGAAAAVELTVRILSSLIQDPLTVDRVFANLGGRDAADSRCRPSRCRNWPAARPTVVAVIPRSTRPRHYVLSARADGHNSV